MNKIKLTVLSVLTLLIIVSSSCSKDEDLVEKTVSSVAITVKYKGVIQTNVSVYMFGKEIGPSSNFFSAFHASKTVVTDDKGIAVFKLQELYDLEMNRNQTTLYFAVFTNEGDAYTGVTIEKGETKSASINIY